MTNEMNNAAKAVRNGKLIAVVASGLAADGKIPFITSYAMFSPGRNFRLLREASGPIDPKTIE